MAQHIVYFSVSAKIARVLRRIPAIFRFILIFFKKTGGLVPVFKKTIKILNRDGLTGVVRKLNYILKQAFSGDLGNLNLYGYEVWFKKYCLVSPDERCAMTEKINAFHHLPLLSVLLPTYNSNPKWLKEAIESVRNQVYPNWELCIADDASDDNRTLKILNYYNEKDSRIKIKFRTKNGHISEASNTALEMAQGDFVALLDHDDLLTEDALFWVATAIENHPGAVLIYSDEDKIDKKDRLSDPYFKCDWNYHLFLSHNMITHLGVYRTSIVSKIGGFRKGFEGAQDYDLALRVTEQIKEIQIVHIPRVLYHWRIHKKSTAKTAKSKPYAVVAAKKAISEHLKRKNIEAEVVDLSIRSFRIKYKFPEKEPLISIIVPTRNNKKYLEKCVLSLLSKTSYRNYEVIIVDNNSDNTETLEYLNELKNDERIVLVRYIKPFNFSAINNSAVINARGNYFLFLNDDTQVINSDWLNEMMGIALQERVGVVGARLWYPDDTLQHGGIILGINGCAGHSHKHFHKSDPGYLGRAYLMQEFSALTGACMLVDRDAFFEAGGFDEENLPIAFNDVDLCLKIKSNGYRVVWTPFAELYHYESKSRGPDSTPENVERFNKEKAVLLERWGELLKNDPAYSPNLTIETEDFGLAWPPRLTEPWIIPDKIKSRDEIAKKNES